MRISISIPMNHYLKCEVIYNTSKIDLYQEYVQMYKLLSAEIVQISDALINRALIKIIERVKIAFPVPCTYRLYQDHHMYIEEHVTE